MSIAGATLWAPSLATRCPRWRESPTLLSGVETSPESADNLSSRAISRPRVLSQYLSSEYGQKEKATGTAFDERDARDGVTSGLDNTIVSHRNRRRKRRAGASGSRTRTRRMSSPLVGPPNRPSTVLVTRGGAFSKGGFEKATGTAFDERDALSGVTTGLDATSLPHRDQRRNAGLERAGVEPARRGCQVLTSDRRIAPALVDHAISANRKALT